MKIVRYSDPVSFRAAIGAYLRRDEARHNLILGLLRTLIDQPGVYDRYRLWLVEADDRPVGAALMTPPRSVVLATPAAPGAIELLAGELGAEDVDLPGVVGGLPEADDFTRVYLDVTGGRVAARMDQAIHVLEKCEDVPKPTGSPRDAGPADLELVLGWYRAFAAEAVPGDAWHEDQERRRLARWLAEKSGPGIRLWEDGGPVSLVGFVHATENGTRIGPVYTPPEHRGRGYATGLVDHVSREMLEPAGRFCLLYTDLANPTSNAIYRRIGYRKVRESAMITFARPLGTPAELP